MNKIALPNFLVPKYKTKLLRFGSKFDGGYLLNETDISKSDTLISLGIHENWDFENELHEKYNLKKIILFDPETSYLLIFTYLIKSIIKLNFRNIILYFKKFNEFKILKSYSIFFKKKFDKNLILDFINSKNILLKVDIEGDEYKNLDFILDNQDSINCLVIEFHDIDNNFKQIKKFIAKFKLKLIHTHINTFSKKDNVAIELTFSKHANISVEKWTQFSLDKIDFPNHARHKNFIII
ncbi:hypothetical protein IDH08_01915 [Pelagibacterales bacterium SAG-MED22]|nr:hypothetical protein [Pelagibacterales bacterium SAG-MED22]